MMKLTINEIAELAQVAKSTVSKALNGRDGVSEEKRELILKLAAQLNYRPSASAQALASSRTGSIGLVLPHEAGYTIAGAYWSAIITAVAQSAREHGYSLLILSPGSDDDLSEPIVSALRRRNVDGFIIGAEDLHTKAVSLLLVEEAPFVLIGRNPRISHYSVDVDNLAGAEAMTGHLLAKGYSRIACLAGPGEYPYTKERVEGYRNALRAAGVAWSAVEYTPYIAVDTREATQRLLGRRPDALFLTAGGGFLFDSIDVLREGDVDLSAFGIGAFDDYPFFDYISVPVSAVRQPLRELGTDAAAMLFELLDGKEPQPMNRVLATTLVPR